MFFSSPVLFSKVPKGFEPPHPNSLPAHNQSTFSIIRELKPLKFIFLLLKCYYPFPFVDLFSLEIIRMSMDYIKTMTSYSQVWVLNKSWNGLESRPKNIFWRRFIFERQCFIMEHWRGTIELCEIYANIFFSFGFCTVVYPKCAKGKFFLADNLWN